jgi:hypothetical protein
MNRSIERFIWITFMAALSYPLLGKVGGEAQYMDKRPTA